LVLTVIMLWAALVGPARPVVAQAGPDGTTDYQLNLRTGPDTGYAVVAVLPPGTGMVFEARNADMSWLLGHTVEGAHRGWIAALYLSYRDGFRAVNLPVSEEIVAGPAPAPAAPAAVPDAAPDQSAPRVPSSLDGVPVLPGVSAQVRQIFQQGQALGNNARVFTTVGDCNTISHAFMNLFAARQYTLGGYGNLQATLDYFAGSFVHDSAAARAGYTAQAIVDPTWSDPAVCPGGVSPLECEYDRVRPSVALIMLGLQDSHFLDVRQYEQGMRQIIEISISRGVIPVLTTFPTWSGENDKVMLSKRMAFNAILVNLAGQYNIPLINLWRATQPLPHSGLEGDLLHLSYSGTATGTDWISFNGDENEFGFTMWNLVALQTLDNLRRNVLAG
jgi:uncharacterized protein YraI